LRNVDKSTDAIIQINERAISSHSTDSCFEGILLSCCLIPNRSELCDEIANIYQYSAHLVRSADARRPPPLEGGRVVL
jgi:hypothetical protein